MRSKVIDIDRGWREIRKTLNSIAEKDSYVKAGVLGEKAAEEHEGVTNAELAMIQEFGAPSKGIPSRPWVSGAFEENRAKYQEMLAKGLAKVYANKLTVQRLLGLMGVQMATDIKQGVLSRENHFTPNAPSTMARKLRKGERNRGALIGPVESPRPLVDTGRMVGSVTFEIVSGHEEGGE